MLRLGHEAHDGKPKRFTSAANLTVQGVSETSHGYLASPRYNHNVEDSTATVPENVEANCMPRPYVCNGLQLLIILVGDWLSAASLTCPVVW